MLYFGIDPDVKESGFAIWDDKTKEIDYGKLSFWEMIKKIDYCSRSYEVKFIIEAGWLNIKSNFHYRPYQTKAAGERIAKNVGSNHQVGKLIAEYCEKYKMDYELIIPKHKKFTSYYLENLTGIKVKNQDIIDAIMLVWGK